VEWQSSTLSAARGVKSWVLIQQLYMFFNNLEEAQRKCTHVVVGESDEMSTGCDCIIFVPSTQAW